MIPAELIKKIRRIQIRTSRIVDEMLAGQYHSAFKGRGMEFEEVRPYQVGDDVRSIDWNVTARTGEPHIKLFREERELAVRLLVDLSASQSLGTHYQTKRDLIAELSATIAFAAIKNNDKVGLTLFTDAIEKAIPPAKGSRHGLRLIREILYTQPIGLGTSIKTAIEHLSRTANRRSVVFVVSDFLDSNYRQALKIATRKHDITPVVVSDRRERTMPNVGLVRLRDSESGETVVFDTGSARNRRKYQEYQQKREEARDTMFRQLKLDAIRLETGEEFVEPLQKFFRKRERARNA